MYLDIDLSLEKECRTLKLYAPANLSKPRVFGRFLRDAEVLQTI
jgi:hypothetical protein